MLNSAAGVALPEVSDPPIMLISLTRFGSDGSRWSAVAMLVSGPMGTSERSALACDSCKEEVGRADSSASGTVGGARVGPSSPLSPWTSGAVADVAHQRVRHPH